ncbi:similar to Saccharomyces cerevisiae YBR237W PRP5 RNA helicase in the DEAD-box family [Maudiozyma saulgeensis]|uniref:RNA helicase n=1 Tax=Maudiozyma saulgeensis TaxID=1789683 RepID=A0A1X7RA78_9SACH|nr:similar to Saccharomyces cerevisiae YBR237W PRP5 RNA helicase in the DEAD-box family [Kazachstania saulgeensis]
MSNGDEIAKKNKLLEARREKLLRWKSQKAKQDAIKAKTVATTIKEQNSNVEKTEEEVLANRRDKLQAWKLKKRKETTSEEPEQVLIKPKKVKKNKKKKLSFDIDYQEPNNNTIPLFRPPVSNNNEIENEDKSALPDTVMRTEADALDDFMSKLNQQEEKNDPKSNQLSTSDILDGNEENNGEDVSLTDDIDEKQAAHYKKIAKMKQLKKVTEVKYNISELEPFQKQFYVEQEDVRKMTTEQVEELRLDLDNLIIKGKDCPNPVTRWSQLGLSTSLMNMITNSLNFKQLTPIQSQALPAIMSGRDVIGISKTGSGKTISYLLPLIRHIKAQRNLAPGETGPLGLILAPTRELAQQIYEETIKFIGKDKDLSCVCCTGGSELKEQIRILKRGVKILVATPGRFIDLLTLNMGKLVNTRRVTFVVIDEADRLFDMGFEPQITQIMKSIRPDKQCVLFSATFPNKLRSFAVRVLHKPLSITVNSSNMVNENIEQSFVVCDSSTEKFGVLLSILSNQTNNVTSNAQNDESTDEQSDEKTIIFVASQQICDFVEKQLVRNGFEIFSIHAGKQYQERISNLESFKKIKNSILLCTEVMSRGLNVPEVSLVIIYNAIKTFAQYVHTTGRTARGVNHGKAISILEPDEIAAAYILTKAMHKQLDTQPIQQVTKLRAMSKEFEDGMKNGKYMLSTGFGGKGLDNLDSKREQKELKERKQYENVSGENVTKKEQIKDVDNNTNDASDEEIIIPKLEYTIIKEENPDGSIIYSANVNINDLPQLVRWETSKNTTLSFVKNETGCSITNKGRYYPPGQGPVTEKDPPKLYLLIEGKEEKDIILGINLLEEKLKEGMKKVEYQTIKSHKF